MGKSLIFPSLLLGVIRKNMNPTEMVQHFMKGKDVTNFRYLLFPLNSGEGPMSRIPHWTLLVYDRINCSWEHFNSSLPRRLDGKEDPFLVDAKEMKSFMQIANGKMKFGIKSNAKLVSVLTSPQQKPDSVDCGMFVLYIARQFCRQQPLDIKDAQNGICALRSDFVHQFLNDEHTVKLD
ncbi:PREDICTED: uncharacterized protein LOC105954836 [Erythranthe guttata]|uniref:uncharacterized protein LOC105954836 n=1 Tax=Erythranthe guttata TaxID=4155 RepID=UPI00064DDFF0|nr:PREDICTED: uncharacterized protein LOC105954836 [Erythranthe guttata]|eukprot:XP_012833980.1 PREDICTED: uncharacterized protein LOC105954836 [Erythranthe guttata]